MTLGSANFDLISHASRLPLRGETLPGEGFSMQPGGKGANQAVRVALSGGRSTFAGHYGHDIFGPMLRAYLEAAGVDIAHFTPAGPSTGIGNVIMEADGNYASVILPGANALFTPAEVDSLESLVAGADALLLQLELPMDSTIRAIHLARRLKVPVVLNAAPAHKLPAELEGAIDFLIVNEVEAEMLSDLPLGRNFQTVQTCCSGLKRYARNVIISLGSSGVYASDSDGHSLRLPAHTVDVVSAVGAGDTFIGEFLVRKLSGAPFFEAISCANAAAAMVISSPEGMKKRLSPEGVEAQAKEVRMA
ncbi:MAG: ribokinase [Treponema sp.]|nr:ribokinase [Treponema sp.]